MHGTHETRGPFGRGIGLFSAAIALLSGLALFGSGCEAASSTVCVARCDCEGCSQKEREDCVDDVDDAERLADYDGCGTEHDKYVDCYGNKGTCSDGVWVTQSCAEQGTALRTCSTRAAKWVRTVCDEANVKLDACGINNGSVSDCTGYSECTALCVLGASCDDILNQQSAYLDCVFGCQG